MLEHVMKHTARIDVGIMQSATAGKGSQSDVFVMADNFKAKKRERRKARKNWTEVCHPYESILVFLRCVNFAEQGWNLGSSSRISSICVQKFMYSREQEAAMRRAAGQNAGGGVMGSFGGLQMLMPWVRARLWEIFGYGMERQPAVERKPRTWTPPTEAGYKGGSIAGDVDGTAAPRSASAGAAHTSGGQTEAGAEPVDCGRAHILTPEEKEVINSHMALEKVPVSEGSTEVSEEPRRGAE